MDRAHKIAQERLPVNEADRFLEHQNQIKREIFCNGYYAAAKDFLERAIIWLKENGDCYTWYNEFEGESGITEGLIEEFKKAMEE